MNTKKWILIVMIALAVAALVYMGFLLHDLIVELNAKKEYPVQYEDLIQKYADEYELDPYLVLSIMRCESSFVPKAVSKKGAIGLMQVMPDSGAWIAHKLGEEPFDESALYDPETNIRFACWYIRFLGNRFNGVTKHMIAAYNAGHGSVEKWLGDPAFATGGALTAIPYPETDRYYTKVTTAYDMYKKWYPDLFGAEVAPEGGA